MSYYEECLSLYSIVKKPKSEELDSHYYGEVGSKTEMEDFNGDALYVGDTVNVKGVDRLVVSKYGDTFIMGYGSSTSHKDFTKLECRKVQNYTELSLGHTGVENFFVIGGLKVSSIGKLHDILHKSEDKDLNNHRKEIEKLVSGLINKV